MTLVTPIAAHKMPDCEGADGRSLIDRSRALNDCLRLHDLITGKIEAACKGVSDNLGLLFSAHMESGRLRNGTILRDGIDAMARLAGQLIDDILDESDPQPKTPDAVQKIREHVVRFLEFLDTEVDRFAKRVEVELECANGHNGIIAPARNLWSEYRDQLIDKLEHRIEVTFKGKGPEHCDTNEAGDNGQRASPPPANDFPKPGFELVAEVIGSPQDVSMRNLALEGQPVKHVRFGPEPKLGSRGESLPGAKNDWHDAWADLIVEICNGRARPKKKAEWRYAFQEVCTRRQIEPDAAVLDEWATLVWHKMITSRYVLSEVHKEIQREAKSTADCDDYVPAFHSETLVSSGSGGSFEGSQICTGSATSVSIERGGAEQLLATAAGRQGNQSGQPSRLMHDLSTSMALAMPVIHIE
jgi:hypothetical protein